MKRSRISSTILTLLTLSVLSLNLAGCSSASPATASPTPALPCGNGICDNGETLLTCSLDCSSVGFSGKIQTTHLKVEGVGEIAIMVASPQAVRYPEGAGVVVV